MAASEEAVKGQFPTGHRFDYSWVYLSVSLTAFAGFLAATYLRCFYQETCQAPATFSFPAAEPPGNAGPLPTDGSWSIGVHYFGDFLATWRQSSLETPYLALEETVASNYPPFLHVVFRPISALDYHAGLVAFSLLTILIVLTPLFLATRGTPLSKRVSLIVGGVVLTAPFVATLDRGNLQGLVTGLSAAAVVAILHNRYWASTTFFTLAALLKLYPAIYVVELLQRRKFKESVALITVSASLTFASFGLLGGGFWTNINAFWNATRDFRGDLQVDPTVGGYNTSLYGFLSWVSVASQGIPGTLATWIVSHYLPLAAASLLLCCAMVFIPSANFLERIILLTIPICLLPTVVGVYVLGLYFAAIAIIFFYKTGTSRSVLVYTVLLALIVSFKGLDIPILEQKGTLVLNAPLQIVLAMAVGTFVIRRWRRESQRSIYETNKDSSASPHWQIRIRRLGR